MADEGGDSLRLFSLLVDLGKKGLERIVQTYANSGHGALIQQLKMYKAMLDKAEMGEDRSSVPESTDEDAPVRDEIDSIFVQIRSLYNQHHVAIILNILELMRANPTDYATYMEGLNAAMRPTCSKIQEWIHKNIIL